MDYEDSKILADRFAPFEHDMAAAIAQTEAEIELRERTEKERVAMFDQIYNGGYNDKVKLEAFAEQDAKDTLQRFNTGMEERKHKHFMYCMDHAKIVDMERLLREIRHYSEYTPWNPMTVRAIELIGVKMLEKTALARIRRKENNISKYQDWYWGVYNTMRQTLPNAAILLSEERTQTLAACDEVLKAHHDHPDQDRVTGVRLPF
ncbi:unnamed protein product [Sphagnum tenellum]